MENKKLAIAVAILACLTVAFKGAPRPVDEAKGEKPAEIQEIEKRSFALGAIAAFSEIVDLGIKKLGFSTTLTTDEADDLLGEAEKLAARYDVKLYREKDLIVTDLFSADIAKGREVLIIYSGDDINDYLDLKKLKELYREEGKYNKAARREVAFKLGKLLSYPEKEIEQLLFEDKKREP